MNRMTSLLQGSDELGWDKCHVGQCNVPSCVVRGPGAGLWHPQGSPEVSHVLLFLAFPRGSVPLESLHKFFIFPSYRTGQKVAPLWLIPTNPTVFFWFAVVGTIPDTSGQVWTFLIFKRLFVQLGFSFSLSIKKPFKVFFWSKGFIYFWNRKSVKVHGLTWTALLPSPNSF